MLTATVLWEPRAEGDVDKSQGSWGCRKPIVVVKRRKGRGCGFPKLLPLLADSQTPRPGCWTPPAWERREVVLGTGLRGGEQRTPVKASELKVQVHVKFSGQLSVETTGHLALISACSVSERRSTQMSKVVQQNSSPVISVIHR